MLSGKRSIDDVETETSKRLCGGMYYIYYVFLNIFLLYVDSHLIFAVLWLVFSNNCPSNNHIPNCSISQATKQTLGLVLVTVPSIYICTNHTNMSADTKYFFSCTDPS